MLPTIELLPAFVLLAVLAHFLVPHRMQNLWLLGASWLFYAWWDWRLLGLLVALLLANFWLVRAMATASDPRRRALLGGCLVLDLGVLAAFKYLEFFVDSAAAVLRPLGLAISEPTIRVILPLGLSFLTFQLVAYAVDVHRRQLEPSRDLVTFLLFGSYFPQVTAGPIPRAAQLLPQLAASRSPSLESWRQGGVLILLGLFKKVGVADALGPLVDLRFTYPAQCAGSDLLLTVYLYALQIYCDFSGYTDLARGVSRLFGIELAVNFRQPYSARSVTEFWQRWHVSLSSWLRDYVFLPANFGLLRRWGSFRWLGLAEEYWSTFAATMATFLVAGLWHGVGWTFVIWGAGFGALLCVHRAWRGWRGRRARRSRGVRLALDAASIMLTFHFVAALWVVFRAPDLGLAFDFFARLAAWPAAGEVAPLPGLQLIRAGILASVVIGLDILQRRRDDETFLLSWSWPCRGLAYGVLLVLTALLGGVDARAPFIYFQF
ncbi:MAG: hypothetical protein MUF10_11745 [Thermoanaerobaculaceae bacterium]|jgi:D-alanyl-lipoteichoic acid acyltransferase DltB (MBOAT superfamily)|nr:hypothetical protein [Thermoanaerobaculaceae bacterium]